MKRYLCSLLAMLVISSLLVAGAGAYIKYEVLEPMGLYQDKSIMELPFLLATDDALIYMVQAASRPTEPTQPPETTVPMDTEPATEPTEPPTQPPTEPPTLPTEPEKVDESWFDDALFIGNSLGVGLRDYARLGDADYFCMIGMNVFNIHENWVFVDGVGNVNLDRLLSTRTYGKIYIHLGTNECGYPLESVRSAFRDLLDKIREKQPDAAIIIQATTTFGRAKARSYRYMVPATITALNEELKTLADGETIFFIDYNPEIVDEEGYLPESYSLDGCHPTVEGYRQWAQWIWDNACYLDIPIPEEPEPTEEPAAFDETEPPEEPGAAGE